MIRNFSIVMLFLMTAFIVSAQPVSDATYRNLFKVSVSKFTRNTFQLGYERYFNPETSMLVTSGMNFRDTDYELAWGVEAEAQVKFHVYTDMDETRSHRLYFAPYVMYAYQEDQERFWNNVNYEEWMTDRYSAIGTGIVFGWSYSFAKRINLDIYTGGGIRKAFDVDKDYIDGVWDYGYSGISPRLGVDVGFWF